MGVASEVVAGVSVLTGVRSFFGKVGMFFHFGAQAVVFAAQEQQTAEEGKHTEHDADNKCTEKHDNQRQIDVLAGR